MPNIVIIGSKDEKLRSHIAEELKHLHVDSDAVITTIPGSVCREVVFGKNAPYLIVRDTQEKRGKRIATALNKALNIDVELEIIKRFFPRQK